MTQLEARKRVLELGTTSGAFALLRELRGVAERAGHPHHAAEVAELEEILRLADGFEFEAPEPQPAAEPRQVDLFGEGA